MKKYTAAHWGIYEIDQSPGGGPILKGLATDPDPSPIGFSMLEAATDDTLRVKRPAVRAGWLKDRKQGFAKDTRGDDSFVEVSWEEALELVAGELGRVKRDFGNASIFGGSYGWSSAGRFHHAQSQIHRFLNAIGGYVAHRDTYSLGAGRVIMPHVVASMEDLMASHNCWDSLIAHTELFVCFGGASAKNAQVSPGGPGQHLVSCSLQELARKGVRIVNISPTKDDLDSGSDFDWIPIKPNTDTAFMLGLAYSLYCNGQHDQAFLDRYAVGFDQFRAYLLGETDGVPKTPQWAAAISGVDERVIMELANAMAKKRTMLNMAWSLQRADYGEQPFWMVVTLAAMLGQIGTPGGGFGVGYGPANTMGNRTALFSGPTMSQGVNKVRDFIPVARITDMLLSPNQPFDYNGKQYTYPDIRLVFWAGGNPFHHHQDLNRLRSAWKRPETVIVNEQYWTPAAKMADIVLPATTSFERDDIAYAKRERYMTYMSKIFEPMGEAKSDYEIFTLLSQKMGAQEVFTEGLDSAAWLERLYNESRNQSVSSGVNLPDFDTFRRVGLVDLQELKPAQPVVMLENFRLDPEKYPLKTPTGKIEIFSATIHSYGLADCGGHAQWYAPKEWLDAQAEQAGYFHLITDQPLTKLHSQLDHSAYSKSNKIQGREPIVIHVDDARKLGLAAGDIVKVFNKRGACLAGVALTENIRPGIARLSTGAWFDAWRSPEGEWLDVHGNPNVLTRDEGTSGLAQGCSAQSCLVSIERYNRELPPINAFSAPSFVSI